MLHFYTRSLTASFLRLLLTFGCFENHGLHGNTRTILKVNVYDFLETLKFKDINGCQWKKELDNMTVFKKNYTISQQDLRVNS